MMPNHVLRHGRLTPPVKAGPRYTMKTKHEKKT